MGGGQLTVRQEETPASLPSLNEVSARQAQQDPADDDLLRRRAHASTMLPFKLPGMVWDPVRKKYFREGSQPAGEPAAEDLGPGDARHSRAGTATSRPSKRLKPGDVDSSGCSRKQRKPLFAGNQASQLVAWQCSLAGPLSAGRDRV